MKFSLPMSPSDVPRDARATKFMVAAVPGYVLICTLAPDMEILGAYLSSIAGAENIVDDLKDAIKLARTGVN